MNRVIKSLLALSMLAQGHSAAAQIVLIGDNSPHGVVNDGEFDQVKAQWRQGVMPPFWSVSGGESREAKTQDSTVGIHDGMLFSSGNECIVESKRLDTNPDYQSPKSGDILMWEFGADLEYRCDAKMSISLVFGDIERPLVRDLSLVGSDLTMEHFSGEYTLTEEDAEAGLPFIRAEFKSELGIKIYIDYINISVYDPIRAATPTLALKSIGEGEIELSWSDESLQADDEFILYRAKSGECNYTVLYSGKEQSFSDKEIISGVKYQYLVARNGVVESAPSNILTLSCSDKIAPYAPTGLRAEISDSEVLLEWDKCNDVDFASYSVYRSAPNNSNSTLIASDLKQPKFEDILAPKMVDNIYTVYAKDYSGNMSRASESVSARVKIVKGAAFSDLILPMPIVGELRDDLWGAPTVLPRDPDNGIESPDWSYWGGRPTFDPTDGKYHLIVVRWSEAALKGHWEWPSSTVAHSVSDSPIGPYRVKDEIAYDYKDGLGHNADIIKLQDGTFALYSLIEWEPTIFTSKSLNGPWERLGVMDIDWQSSFPQNEATKYQYERNLTGVDLGDGRFIFVTKFGATMVSDSGILGTYRVVTDGARYNETIPQRYRYWNYEDPVMWRDEVQFHMIINAFIAKRAIYLRSGDGIHWEYDPGLAYTPDFTSYENGVVNHWDKLERPHVLQDEYGRATHLSLAVIDVDKALDYGGDNHNSKNIIIPLVVPRRVEMLNKSRVTAESNDVSILLRAERGFDPNRDVNIESLRFGSDEEVNYGRGAKVTKSKKRGNDILLEFSTAGVGVTESDFVLKLLGEYNDGSLLIGYTKLQAE